ncbi:MAG: hypothetical protein AB8B74_03245 [Crocinitomicaceae bacterium]
MKMLKYLSLVALLTCVFSCGNSSNETSTDLCDKKKKFKLEKLSNADNTLLKNQADVLIDAYRAEVTANHFSYSGNKITGYCFKRAELIGLLQNEVYDSLFLMWGLSEYDSGQSKYLNLILAPVKNKVMPNGKNFLKSSYAPSTFQFSKNLNVVYKKDSINENGDILTDKDGKALGAVITYQDLDNFSYDFRVNGSHNHLLNATYNTIVKGYTISLADLQILDVRGGNGSNGDVFVFIPIIRPAYKNPSGSFQNKSYLSIAVGRIDESGMYVDDFIEYCDPCPSQCMNYEELFID